jgi:hypothetical protein
VNVSTARHLSKSYIQTSSAVPELANYASLCERTGQRVLHAERQGSGAHSVVHGRGSCIPVFCGRAGSALFSFSAPVSAGIPWLMLGAQARGPSSAELETKRLLSADRGAGRQWGQLQPFQAGGHTWWLSSGVFCTCLFGRLPSAFVASYPAIWAAWAALKTHLVAFKHIPSMSMPQRPTVFDRFQALYHADCLRDMEWTNPAAERETFGLTRAGSTGHGALSLHITTPSVLYLVMCTG